MEWGLERNDLCLKYIIEMSKTRKKYSAGRKKYSAGRKKYSSAGRTSSKSPNDSEYHTPKSSPESDSGYHTALDTPPKKQKSSKKQQKIAEKKQTNKVPHTRRQKKTNRNTPPTSPTQQTSSSPMESTTGLITPPNTTPERSELPPSAPSRHVSNYETNTFVHPSLRVPLNPLEHRFPPSIMHRLKYNHIQNRVYASNQIPSFWLPLFHADELIRLRSEIQEFTKNNGSYLNFSICNMVTSIIPKYTIPTKNDPIEKYGIMYRKTDYDFHKFNQLLCAVFFLYGIISNRLMKEKYSLVFKGGKAVQILMSQFNTVDNYSSEDIDILIIPNDGVYNLEEMRILSSHIGHLVYWLLNIDENTISVKIPSTARDNPYVTKIAYTNRDPYYSKYIVISDIDVKPISEFMLHYYTNTSNYFIVDTSMENWNITYRTLSILPFLDEKIYYYILYYTALQQKKNGDPIEDPELAQLSEEMLNLFLDKFRRSIYALTRAIALSNVVVTRKNNRMVENIVWQSQYDFLNSHVLIRNISYRNEMIQSILLI
jgi:hypothetical protein